MTRLNIFYLKTGKILGSASDGDRGITTDPPGLAEIVRLAMKEVGVSSLGEIEGWSNGYLLFQKGVSRRAKYMLTLASHSTGIERPRRERQAMTLSVKRRTRAFRESDVVRDEDGRFADVPGRGDDAPATPARGTTVRRAVRADDARRTGRQTRSNFSHPVTGHAMGKTETGDTYEALFEAKGAPLLEERYGGSYEAIAVTGGFQSRNTPLDFKVGEYGGELKSLSVNSTNQKTAIKKDEIERKEKAVADAGLKPLLVVQVVNQESGQVQVYAFEAFASKAVAKMEHVGGYSYSLEDFEAAQRKTGHHDKREARAAAQAG